MRALDERSNEEFTQEEFIQEKFTQEGFMRKVKICFNSGGGDGDGGGGGDLVPLRTRASIVSGSFLCRLTALARRRIQDAKCLATCSKAPLICSP